MKRILLPALTLALALVITETSPVEAQDYPTISIKVKTSDLDLSSERGTVILRQRIHLAATTACANDDPLYRATDYLPCIAKANDTAINRLNSLFADRLNSSHETSANLASLRIGMDGPKR